MGYHRFLRRAVAVSCIALLAACANKPTNYTPIASIQPGPPPPAAPRGAYRLGPGDELEVKFYFAPELNDRMTVRPDGKVSIMFAQDIQAAGLTADELASDIRAVLAPHVKQLDLVVIVRSFASQKAYVGGEVFKPGLVPLTGGETLLQAIAVSGWTNTYAGDKALLVRRDASSQEKIYSVSLQQLQDGVNMAQNVAIEPGDIVLVPPDDVVEYDRWVDRNIRQLIPVVPSAGISYNINSKPTQ